jgi:membrane protein implicated in regulation of membrane protease activity
MKHFDFFPSDDRIAQSLGLSGQLEALQPYSDYLGYPMWCAIAAVFFVLEMMIPQCRTSWILASAIITGVIVKLGDIYSWGLFSLGEQGVMFFLITIATFCVWRTASRTDRPGGHAEA